MMTLSDPAILFFLFGLLAGFFKSNLEIPQQISSFLSLYLLMALGLKGGFALAKTGFSNDVLTSLGCAVGLAIAVPLIAFQILKRLVPHFDAAAIAATYGSVSAVTFITATQILDHQGITFGGHMAAAMALMESPAIIIAIIFANQIRHRQALASGQSSAIPAHSLSIKKLLHESFTDGAQLLLFGSLIIGMINGEAGQDMMRPFSVDLFKGLLAFFLLDMGLLAARNVPGLKNQSPWVFGFGIIGPLFHASLALLLASLCGLSLGDSILLMVLASSASYIAVPAVVRYAIPEANPSLYIGMSLALTFPLNLIFGIPLYIYLAELVIH